MTAQIYGMEYASARATPELVGRQEILKIIEKAIATRGAFLDRKDHWAKKDRPAFLFAIEDLKRKRSIAERRA